MPEDEATLLEVVKDGNRPWVNRGEAVEKLCQSGRAQADIARLTNLATPTISHLRTCFLNLTPKARKMSERRSMNADACYSLANATRKYQERVLTEAIRRSKERDANRATQKGRRSPTGQITNKDVNDAIAAVRYEAL